MLELLKLLIDLQKLDKVIYLLQKEKESIPGRIKELQDTYESELETLNEYKKNMAQLQLEKKSKELDLESKEEIIKKHQKELNSIKSNEAYKKMLKQIEDAGNEKKVIEDGILEIMQGSEDLQKKLKDKKEILLESKSNMDKETAELTIKLEKINSEGEELEKTRSEFLVKIPNESLESYEKLRENKATSVVVNIDGDSCSGCHINVTHHVKAEVLKAKEIVTCMNCGRILYCEE